MKAIINGGQCQEPGIYLICHAVQQFEGVGHCAGQKQGQSEAEEEVKAKQPVMLGRKDYLIRSLDPGTGTEHWNVTYSEIVHLDVEQSSAYETSSSAEIASYNSLDGTLLDQQEHVPRMLALIWDALQQSRGFCSAFCGPPAEDILVSLLPDLWHITVIL